MEPYGDPEARIRDLERPLADQAGASELGARPYETTTPPTVPVPPSDYGLPPMPEPYTGQPYPQPYQPSGSPYYAPPQHVVQKRTAGTALWLIPLVAGIVIAGGIVGAVVYFTTSGGTAYTPTPASPRVTGGGSLTVPVPSLPSIPGVGGTEQTVTVEPGGSLSIGGSRRTQTVVCNDGTVTISGASNTIEIQGSCGAVTVSGTQNRLTVESARTIEVSGFDNSVTYRGGDPEISRSGSGNTVEQG